MDTEKKEVVFADGFIFKKKGEKAPESKKFELSIKVDEAVPMLEKNINLGYAILDLLKGKSGKVYMAVNTWRKDDAKERITTEMFSFKKKRDNQPDFVLGSFRVNEIFIDFLKKHNNDGWVNLDVFKFDEDFQITLNNWKPATEDFAKGSLDDFDPAIAEAEAAKKAEIERRANIEVNINPDDIPF
jgi:hypothetical protein